VFDSHRTTWPGRQGRMLPAPRLETGLLISRDDKFIASQAGPVPGSGIEIQQAAGFLRKLGIAGENPAPMSPGLQRIGAQPTPQGDPADLCDEAAREDLAPQFPNGEARQRYVRATGQLTSEPFNVDDDAGGKSGLPARLEAPPQGRVGVLRKSGGAIC
jgi:hypothetical protein